MYFQQKSSFQNTLKLTTPTNTLSFSQISGSKRARGFGICITPNCVFLTNLGKLKTLESHNPHPRRSSWTAQQQKSRTGYPAIEQAAGPGGWPRSCESILPGGQHQEDSSFPPVRMVCTPRALPANTALPSHGEEKTLLPQ